MDTHEIIHKILEVAYEIALRAVAKSKEKALIARGCAASKLIKYVIETFKRQTTFIVSL